MQKIVRLSILSALVLTAAFVRAEQNAERAAKAGELVTLKNHRVLRLKGADVYERGFAEGYLLAEELRDDFDAALESLPTFGAKKYEAILLPWAKKNFEWDADARSELDGIFAGMSARLGKDGLLAKTLGRAITRDDIMAVNTIADYFGPACSGFAAWGKHTQNGEAIHGRTLDFPIGPKAVADQLLIVSDPIPGRADGRPARKGWVAVGWPALLVQYTGMSSGGLVVCLHDAYNLKRGDKEGAYVARGLLLRRMLETIDPQAGDPAEQGAKMAAEHASACGNLFHMTWSKAAAEKNSTTPSAVLEFDPSDRKVTIRRMDESGVLVVTNHFRTRNKPVACERFKNISSGVDLLDKAGKPIGVLEARKLLMSAEQPVAAHSVYFFPDRLQLEVALTKNNVMSPRVAPVEFSMKELFK